MTENTTHLRRSSRVNSSAKINHDVSEKDRGRSSVAGGNREHSPDILLQELESELKNISEDTLKPTELQTDDQDVRAARIYKFQTPTKSNAMAAKAAVSRTPATPKTPKRTAKHKSQLETAKTPHSVRTRMKQKLASITSRMYASNDTSSESESVSEDDEFVPSSDEDDTDDAINESKEEDISNESESEHKDHEESMKRLRSRALTTVISSKRISRHGKDGACNDYHLKTDDYFERQLERVVTSNHTMGRLTHGRLDEEKLQSLLSTQSHVSEEHKKALRSMTQNYHSMFPLWYCLLEEGYSLLLYGVGSKRMLINEFHQQILADHPTLVVNGFFPSLTIKEILDGIIVDILELDNPTNQNESLKLIETTLKENPDDRLCVLILNIDGIMLRSEKAQDALSSLASIPNLFLVASIDHINTPLLWDNVKHSRYNFSWWDATTYLPYDAEISFESSLLTQQSGVRAISSLRSVFRSLTTNARAIYLLLVKYQLEQANNHTYPGIPFKELYSAAREGFLVSSDLSLRAQLTEFIDHKLIRSKRNVDGTEYLTIPLENTLLKQFLEDQESS